LVLAPNTPIRFASARACRVTDRGPSCRGTLEEARQAERAADGLAAAKRNQRRRLVVNAT
jgi:hypothetical protein